MARPVLPASSFRCLVLAALVLSAGAAAAQPEATPALGPAPAAQPQAQSQGVAVLGTNGAREEAFGLARAVYATTLRPHALDEVRARVLAGDAPPPNASKEVRELAELRAGVSGDDAASRQLLATIARQTGVQALLVVSVKRSVAPAEAGDAGASEASDAGAEAGIAPEAPTTTARLFLADSGEIDAARYEPAASGWNETVSSLGRRFPSPKLSAPPQALTAPAQLTPGKDSKPFYYSPWLWGAVGAAALVGGFFFFATQDKSDDPIHLQMRVGH